MANYHREVYQPSQEDGPTYDLADEEVDDARARLPLLIVIALLVLASFAGVVWLAYNQGLERGLVAAPAIIDAPGVPIRTLPSEDSVSVPYTGLKIYNDPIPPDEEAEASNLAVLQPTETPPSAAPVPQATPQPVVTPAPAPQAQPVAAVTPQATPQPVQSAPTPAPTIAATAATAPASAPASAAASGGAVLQVGAYPSEAMALEAWETFRAQHGAMVPGLSEDIQRADLGENGIWYRVRVGPFTSDVAASATCENLIANGGSCFVAAP
jgi:cell division protein FtsN